MELTVTRHGSASQGRVLKLLSIGGQ